MRLSRIGIGPWVAKAQFFGRTSGDFLVGGRSFFTIGEGDDGGGDQSKLFAFPIADVQGCDAVGDFLKFDGGAVGKVGGGEVVAGDDPVKFDWVIGGDGATLGFDLGSELDEESVLNGVLVGELAAVADLILAGEVEAVLCLGVVANVVAQKLAVERVELTRTQLAVALVEA